MSTVKNADLWRVAFVDANDQPATPDGPISWQVERNRRILDIDGNIIPPDEEQVTTTVEPDTETAPGSGVYLLSYVPQKGGTMSVKAYASVEGVMQAVPATQVEVER